MVRVPAGWATAMTRPAGSLPARTGTIRPRVPVTPWASFTRLVNTDIGNDGISPAAVFNASGDAAAVVGPSGLGQTWSLDQAYVSTSAGQLDPAQCSLYVGPLAIATYLSVAGLSGGGSQFGLGGIGLGVGWYVWAAWTGGTPGATAQLRVTGVKSTLAAA